ncbi:hypothetical protein ABFT80_00760 [Mesorhizobium sp. SB112]|uniref:hypothetical protein n=1 Tax=Mesorhizobium sp. SB112 TaxID=3151853 RepID=UPI00326671C5
MSKKNTSFNDWPQITERHWYVFALVSAVFTGVAIVGAFFWIFLDGFDGDRDLKKAQALAPFGVALFALVTFCTASWRGAISTRQANQAESEGRAKLLQEGAKLLGETNKAAHVSAGIASLGVLVSGDDKSFAFPSMNLLADFVEDHMSRHHGNRHRSELSGVMKIGVDNGINTRREIYFDAGNDENQYHDEYETDWHYIPGFEKVHYIHGRFSRDVNYELSDLRNVTFRYSTIQWWKNVIVDLRFYRCNFDFCNVSEVSNKLGLSEHEEHKLHSEIVIFQTACFTMSRY